MMEQNNNEHHVIHGKLNGEAGLYEDDLGGVNGEGVASDETDGSATPPTPSTLTLRMIMQGKEAGSIIGKKGENIKRFREESGARINISDASCPERIVTVTGTTEQIVSAFTMICRRFEEDIQSMNPSPMATQTKQLITLRLIIPASQCGSLIGKGGAKIKEIRDVAGASIQISSDMLPNSTERSVTVSGSVDAISRGIYHICGVMLECPPKGATIPYRPRVAAPVTPVIFAGGQAYALQGQYVIAPPNDPRLAIHQQQQLQLQLQQQQQQQQQQHQQQLSPATMGPSTHVVPYQAIPAQQAAAAQAQQYAKMTMLPQGLVGHPVFASQQAYIAAYNQALAMGGYIRAPTISMCHPAPTTTQTHEMSIPNELIGCIIGRGGTKINEIRQLSGANIKISGSEEGLSDRIITVTGPPESINAAIYLINARLVEWSYKGYV